MKKTGSTKRLAVASTLLIGVLCARVGAQAPVVDNDGGASNITASSAAVRGDLTSTGGSPTTVRAYWGPTDGGTDAGTWSNVANMGVRPAGSFSTNITGLTSNTTYYYRCWASNISGVAWAPASTNFTTGPTPPTVNNANGAQGVTTSSAWLMGNLTTNGGLSTIVIVYWGLTDGGTTNSAWSNTCDYGVVAPGPFVNQITDLSASTKYYYRCYASNSMGGAWAPASTNFTTGPDADGDGMNDSWETNYFGNTTTAGAFTDYDGDRARDRDEYVAGTDPTNRLSVLVIRKTMPLGTSSNAIFYDDEVMEWMTQEVWSSTGGPCVLYWSTVTGRTYRFYGAPAASGAWSDLTGPIPGSGAEKAYTNTDWGAAHRFYRIGAELP